MAEEAARVREILRILHKWGIRTLGQFAALHKEELAARLGPEAVRLWERANGRSLRLLRLVQPPESFVETYEFEHEVETIEPLLFILRRLLEQLSVRLRSIFLVARELTLRLEFTRPQPSYQRCFQIPQPTTDIDLLFRMLHTHLENFKSEQPIVAVSVEMLPGRAARQQFGLFETALRDPNQLYETLGRLIALLGKERVGTPVLEETHRPDVFRMEPFAWQLEEDNVAQPPAEADQVKLRPALRRFRKTMPASVLREEARPVHVRSAEVSGEVTAQEGPYFASGNWWDNNKWQRAEWDVRLPDETILRCHEDVEGWKVDGIYD